MRRAVDGEVMQGIDHREYTLTAEDLVIADADRPVAIAGVMGGAATEVTEATTRVLLECACFQTTTVRKSAKRHGLHTESSHRFERGVDPGATLDNLWHAAHTMLDALGPEARITGWAEAGQGAPAATTIALPADLCARYTGMPITDAQMDYARRVKETLEESGVRVGEVRYVASQPWPFVSSLMIGCIAEAISHEIVIDGEELEDCRWFSREDAAAMLERRHASGLMVPTPMAIAYTLVRSWVSGETGFGGQPSSG